MQNQHGLINHYNQTALYRLSCQRSQEKASQLLDITSSNFRYTGKVHWIKHLFFVYLTKSRKTHKAQNKQHSYNYNSLKLHPAKQSMTDRWSKVNAVWKLNACLIPWLCLCKFNKVTLLVCMQLCYSHMRISAERQTYADRHIMW